MSLCQEEKVVSLPSRKKLRRRQLVEKLFGRHARALCVFLRGRSVPEEQIDDITQEVFAHLMVVNGLEEKMSDSLGSNRSYLLTMANNMLANRHRKSRVRRAYSAAQLAVERERRDEHSPERIVEAQLELEAIKAVILGMRPHWRAAFVLHRFHNLNYGEIAVYMGLTKKQVEHYILRALRKLRQARRTIQNSGEHWC